MTQAEASNKDIRETAFYKQAEAVFAAVRQPGSGQISDATELHVTADGGRAVFVGAMMDKLEGAPSSRLCEIDLASGAMRVMTYGPGVDQCPKYSPDARCIAFLSDRHQGGDFQLYLLDPLSGAARATPRVEGWVEYLQWSPDGQRILLGVAGHGADVAGGEGAIASKQKTAELPSWMPKVDGTDENYRWRRAWTYELSTNRVCLVSGADTNVWEAAWCGSGALAAVVSPGPSEGLWYSARLHILNIDGDDSREIHVPSDQIGLPAASPSGRHLAVVEAVCSDRGIIAGDFLVFDTLAGCSSRVDTHGVDIAYGEWRSERHLLIAGHRGLETVIGLYDVETETFGEVWASREVTSGGVYAKVCGFGDAGGCVWVGESFVRAPQIAVIENGEYRVVRSLDLGGIDYNGIVDAVECVSWLASDGLQIQGWLIRPKSQGPSPLVMYVHGGPVWHWRPTWLGRRGVALILLQRGYAVFFPNPRGSSGQGRDFARRVVGDMGGADTNDLLSGIDHLVNRGLVDSQRVGVMGGSYGGFMTSWLITQDARFAAAVPMSPHTNQVTQHLLSNIPHFMELFLADHYRNPGGRYFSRSPIMYADRASTPTLNICGALDRCTPPEEAMQFHNALLQAGVRSVLVTYPAEGHGVRKFPALIDMTARIVAWFEEHMPAQPGATGEH